MARMFRRRLTIAFAVLALAAVVQGLVAVVALAAAERQVQRGRVASDIQLGFVELSAAKQRLRTWVAQVQLGMGTEPTQRDGLLVQMRDTVDRLQGLARRAVELDGSAALRSEHVQRQDAVTVLALSLNELERAVQAARPLGPQTGALEASEALAQLFDFSGGRDLRVLLADSTAREAAAVTRERAAADASQRDMRRLWQATGATLALATLVLAAYFGRRLRGPLDALAQGVQALQRGQLQHRIRVSGRDEFAVVARSINAMAVELAGHRDNEDRTRQRLEEQVRARTAELEEAMRALQQANARRRRLFADISHELRTPTTAIRGEAEVTLRGSDRPVDDYKAALRRIADGSRQLGLVIDDLLTMARSDIDALALNRQTLDLAGPLADALEQARALAQGQGVTVRPEALPEEPLPVLGDPQRLQQLLMVLLDNAVRYSRRGGAVRVRVRRLERPGAAPGCEVEVEVQDEGIGIAPHELPRVFERSFRGEQARRHRADGTGLGLAIGQALARAHGGEIRLESVAGAGTTATLRLPLLQQAAQSRGVTA